MQQMNRSVAFVTLGCAKNEVDTDKMEARLDAAGFSIVDDLANADLIIVNTCAFLVSAVDEGLEVIFDLVNGRNELGGHAKILVAGCMPSRYGDELSEALSEVDGFVSVADEEHIVQQARRALGLADVEARDVLATKERFASKPSAYVKISDGCDRFCSYCMIPYIRGRYHSYPMEEIMSEVSELVDAGTREIVFIGQDTGIWGRDLDAPSSLADLLEAAATRFPDTWFRVLYVQPEGIDDRLLDCMREHDNICSYLDMPLQHADADVLKAMNRSGSAQSYLQLLEHVRSRVPGIVCRTTFMAGFPQETDEQFQTLLDFAQAARFDYAGVFPYSPEEGSAAAEFEGQIDEDVKIERAQQLLDVCEAIGRASCESRVGDEVTVLVEGYGNADGVHEALCRFSGQAPEVDGQVHVPVSSPDELPVGVFATVRITDSFFFELEGEVIGDE